MQIYNMDETVVTAIPIPGEVVTEVGHSSVWASTSGEKGKAHTILTCVSASVSVLPSFNLSKKEAHRQ